MQFNFTNKNFVSVKNSEGTKLGRINLKKGEFQVSKDNNPRGDEQEDQFLMDWVKGIHHKSVAFDQSAKFIDYTLRKLFNIRQSSIG